MIYLFLAYTLIWVGVLWYALGIAGKNRALSEQVKALEAALAAAREGSARTAGAGGASAKPAAGESPGRS